MMSQFKSFQLLACSLLVVACSAQQEDNSSGEQKEQQKEESQTKEPLGKLDKKKVSYALGYNMGDVLYKTDENLNMEELVKGLKDAFSRSDSSEMTEEEIKNTLVLYNLEISAAMKEKQEEQLRENVEKGKDFIAQYSKDPEVEKDDSGIYYKVVEKGSGPIPQETDQVLVEYTGKKIGGEVFFSTASTGQPAQFILGDVIQGWQAALKKMPVGSTWEVVLPPEAAYGDRGVADVIGPGETLIFEITLKEILDDESEKEAQ